MNTLAIRLGGIFLFLVSSFICGCGGETTLNSAGSENAVKVTFNKWRDAILNEDWKTTYELTSSSAKRFYKSYEAWELDYKTSDIKRLLEHIDDIKFVAIDETGASIGLVTKDGIKLICDAVVEFGQWRIRRLIYR